MAHLRPLTTSKTGMEHKIRETFRDRHLTEEEAAKYRKIRKLVVDELPELRARAKARLRELRDATPRVRSLAEAASLNAVDCLRKANQACLVPPAPAKRQHESHGAPGEDEG